VFVPSTLGLNLSTLAALSYRVYSPFTFAQGLFGQHNLRYIARLATVCFRQTLFIC
jgi:hypothetical protein